MATVTIFLTLSCLVARAFRNPEVSRSCGLDPAEARGEAPAFVQTGAAEASSRDDWPDVLPVVTGAQNASYKDLMGPVVEAISLSYTATYGGYFKEKLLNATIRGGGWLRRPELDKNPEGGGMHALVFYDPERQLAILAFRGTDLLPGSDSNLADDCANKMLWYNAAWDKLPPKCAEKFSAEELDYLPLAQSFAADAKKALGLNPSQILLTGHSTGGGLAVLVAAKLAEGELWPKVLAVSAPPCDAVLTDRVGIHPSDLISRGITVLYNALDPVYRGLEPPGSQTGVQKCVYEPPSTERVSCEECYGKGWSMREKACFKCIMSAHALKSYLTHLSGGVEFSVA